MRFAHIFHDGTVDTAHSSGISQENVTFSEIMDPVTLDQIHSLYCIVGLPPPLGAQASGDQGSAVAIDPHDEQLELTSDGACIIQDSPPVSLREYGIHVLLLY